MPSFLHHKNKEKTLRLLEYREVMLKEFQTVGEIRTWFGKWNQFVLCRKTKEKIRGEWIKIKGVKNRRCQARKMIRLIPRRRWKHKGLPKSGSINFINLFLWSSLSTMTPSLPSKSGLRNGQCIITKVCSTEKEFSISFRVDCNSKEFCANFAHPFCSITLPFENLGNYKKKVILN